MCLLAACDPMYAVSIRNHSDARLYVQIGDDESAGRLFLVPAHSGGRLVDGPGEPRRWTVVVMHPDCTPVQSMSLPATTDSVVVIDPHLSVRLGTDAEDVSGSASRSPIDDLNADRPSAAAPVAEITGLDDCSVYPEPPWPGEGVVPPSSGARP